MSSIKHVIAIIAVLIYTTTCSALAQGHFLPPEKWKTEPTWSPDGTLIAVRGEDLDVPIKIGEQRYHYLRDGNTFVIKANDYSVVATFKDADLAWPSWSPNGKFLASRLAPLEVYDVMTGSLTLKNDAEPTSRFAWSPDSRRILSVDSKSLTIFDLEKKASAKFHSEQHGVYWESPTWSPDGTEIAAMSTLKEGLLPQCEIKVWNSKTYDQIRKLQFKSRVGSISWTPDGKLFVYSVPESIKFDDSDTYSEVRKIETKSCAKFSWSPLKHHLIYKDEDLLHILDSQTFQETHTIQGPKNGVFQFDWSRDESLLLINGSGTVAIFDAHTGKPLGYKSLKDLTNAYFSPDGKSIVLSILNSWPRVVSIAKKDIQTGIIEGGKTGVPEWANYPSPENLEQCFDEFDKALTIEEREKFKNTKDIGKYGGGSFVTDSMMCNAYDYWGHFRLKAFFEKHGIDDPRDVFGIVLTCYHRYLNGKPLGFDELVKEHKAWWECQKPIIEENKKLSSEILDMRLADKRLGDFSIGSLKSKLKIVSYIDTDGVVSAKQLECFERLRTKYPSGDIAIVVLVVAPENLTKERWPSLKMKVLPQDGESPAATILGFQINPPTNIAIAKAPYPICQAFLKDFQFSRYQPLGPPQTILINETGYATFRLNGFSDDVTSDFLEKQIKEALSISSP